MWRALSLVAPSLKLNPEHPQPLFMAPFYPIGVVPDKLLQPQAFFSIYRDTYANTSCVLALHSTIPAAASHSTRPILHYNRNRKL